MDLEAGIVTYPSGEHLGIAVDTAWTDRAAIRDAGDLKIAGSHARSPMSPTHAQQQDHARRASGGTFSITNLGSNGALFDTPIINQPQVAILGIGAVVKRPVVITDPSVGESIAVRSMADPALTYDHRLVDGADAGRFLTAVKQRLQAGAFEVELGS